MKKALIIGTIILIGILQMMPLEETRANEQQGKIYGSVYILTAAGQETLVEDGAVLLEGQNITMETLITSGYYEFANLTAGEYTVYCRVISCEESYKTIILEENSEYNLDFFLNELVLYTTYNVNNAKIYGTVKDAETNKLVNGASISISSYYGYGVNDGSSIRYPYDLSNFNKTSTDENGYYEMNCWSGDNYLTVYAEGYRDYSVTVLLNESEAKQFDVQLVAKPPKSVRMYGSVYDRETNQPIKDAYISLNNYEYMEWQSNQTDEQGSFELWAYEGYSSFQVWADGYNSYDATYHLTQNDSIELTISLKPKLQPDCILQGYILNESGSPVKDVYVNAWNQELYAYGSNMTDENGYFKILLIHGYYTLDTNIYGYYPVITNAEIDAGDTLEVTLTLKEGYNNLYLVGRSESANDWVDTAVKNEGESQGILAPTSDGDGTEINQNTKLALETEKSPGFELIVLFAAAGVIILLKKRN